MAASLALLQGCRRGHQGCPAGETCEDEPLDEPPPTTLSCNLDAYEGSPTGQCIPLVEAGWDTSLVKMAHIEKHLLHCPPSAPFAGFRGEEIPPIAVAPRSVIGCSVQPLATCSSLAWTCVHFEDGYPACINQTGLQPCPAEYPDRTIVQQEADNSDATVCCRSPKEPS